MEARPVDPTPHTENALGMLFIFCFICFYACETDAMSYIYCSEIFPLQLCARGMVFFNILNIFVDRCVLRSRPTALANCFGIQRGVCMPVCGEFGRHALFFPKVGFQSIIVLVPL